MITDKMVKKKKPIEIPEEEIEEIIQSKGHEHVYIICAHSDDQILGPGGTIAKLSKEGAKVTTIILSFGELTPAWLKDQFTIKTRVGEAQKADKIVGGHEVKFIGLKEGSFIKQAKSQKVYESLGKLIRKDKPSIIFTHRKQDPQPDHKATVAIVKDVVRSLPKTKRPDLYSFNIWNPFDFSSGGKARLVVDVSGHFKKKMKALMVFKSQRLVILQLIPGVFLGAKFNGIIHGKRFVEVFNRIFLD